MALALLTSCRPREEPLPDAVAALRGFGLLAVALHRAPAPEEVPALAELSRRVRIVAVFGEPGPDVGCRLLVVEGAPALPDRGRSLEDFCRRIHGWRGYRVAVKTPLSQDRHPSPGEIPLLAGAVRHAGYWHVVSRGGAEHLETGARHLFGASFDPRAVEDLVALRDALPSGAPAVIDLPSGCAAGEIRDAVSRAGGVFRA